MKTVDWERKAFNLIRLLNVKLYHGERKYISLHNRAGSRTHTHDDDVESGGEECSDLKDEVIKKLIFATAADSETAQLTRI